MDEDNIDFSIGMGIDFSDLESLDLVEVNRGALNRHLVRSMQLEVSSRGADARGTHHAFDFIPLRLFCEVPAVSPGVGASNSPAGL